MVHVETLVSTLYKTTVPSIRNNVFVKTGGKTLSKVTFYSNKQYCTLLSHSKTKTTYTQSVRFNPFLAIQLLAATQQTAYVHYFYLPTTGGKRPNLVKHKHEQAMCTRTKHVTAYLRLTGWYNSECKSNPLSYTNSGEIFIYNFDPISETSQLFIPIFKAKN